MLETALITFLIGSQLGVPPSSGYRIEREPVSGGSELVTLFGRMHSAEPDAPGFDVPLLSVLRDTLGTEDPDAARLRYVWILTSTPPTPLQRLASTLFFVRFRTGDKEHADRVPSPLMDLAAPSKTVWSNLLGDSMQLMQLDARGAAIRSSTRSYRENSSDYRRLQVFRSLGALDTLVREPGNPGVEGVLPSRELRELYSRLSLSDKTFGGLVRPETVSKFYDKEMSRQTETRGHNWELLRQRAESEGLYFEPLSLPGGEPTQALIWIAREDVKHSAVNRHFDSQFLGIADPWNDPRLREWTGYSETRYFDAENRHVPARTKDARELDLIPLALYSLDYPRVPFLLVDFRDDLKPKRREMLHHGVNAVVTGVLGISRYGNWPFLAATTAWNFVRGRHGSPTDRAARLRSYSEAREFLAADPGMRSELKAELLQRLDHLALNPLENALDTEVRVAKEQYTALMQYAASPGGLQARIGRDRKKELDAYEHSRMNRLLAAFGRLFRGGSPDPANQELLRAELAGRRRADTHIRYLEELLASSPRPEVVRDPSQVGEVIEALATDPEAGPRAPRLIAELFARSGDYGIRMACLRSLQRSQNQEAKNQLLQLSRNPAVGDSWRALSMALLKGGSLPAVASAGGRP